MRIIVKRIIPLITLLSISLYPLSLNAQNNIPGCQELKTGTFYYYAKTGDHSFIKREDEFQYETDLKTGDTSVWKIEWKTDCIYIMKYVSGNAQWPPESMKLLKKHKFAFEIAAITSEYYVYKGYLDNVSGTLILADTIWFSEKANIVNNQLIVNVPGATFETLHFTDTSKYALLYLYRPGKITNSLGNYLVYCNDYAICVAKNRTGYIFKILKEGNMDFTSRLFKDSSTVSVAVKFGKTYYIKSMTHWAITSRLYNFKLEMEQVSPEIGKEEFGKVKLQ